MRKKIQKSLLSIFLVAALVLAAPGLARTAFADFEIPTHSGDTVTILTAEGLLGIADDPYACYELGADIDMSGYDWTPIEFCGQLEGNGHSILNLTIKDYSKESRTVFDSDGNSCEAHFAGLFGIMENAYVRELNLLGINYDIDAADVNIYAGALTGYIYGSYAETVSARGSITVNAEGGTAGSGTDSSASSDSETGSGHSCGGIGGLAGYGGSSALVMSSANLDITETGLACVGGIYGFGYIDLYSDSADVNVYCNSIQSVDGLTDNENESNQSLSNPASATEGLDNCSAGLIGAFVNYDNSEGEINISDCSVSGSLYYQSSCIMTADTIPEAGSGFIRNSEILEFTACETSEKLCPHWDCTDPKFTEEVHEHTESDFGYTVHTCSNCGYSYTDSYTIKFVPIESCTLEFSKTYEEGEKETDKIYLGDEGFIFLTISPYNATLSELKLVSDSEGVVIGEAQAVNSGTSLIYTAPISFNDATASLEGASGDHHIAAYIDGTEATSLDLTVEGVFASWWNAYGAGVSIIIGAALLVSALSTALILYSAKKQKAKKK